MAILDGEQQPFKTKAQRDKLVGKHIKYLRGCDIDKSGRGYYFPRFGYVESVHGRDLFLDTTIVHASDLVEVVIWGEDNER